MLPTKYRTDAHRNPTALTTDIAKEAGLLDGVEYIQGEPFTVPAPGKEGPLTQTLYTARLIGDPIALTIRVIDRIGFFAGTWPKVYGQRWNYIAIPKEVWLELSPADKAAVIGGMYNREGGTEMNNLFPVRFNF